MTLLEFSIKSSIFINHGAILDGLDVIYVITLVICIWWFVTKNYVLMSATRLSFR